MLGHWWLPASPKDEVCGILSSTDGRMKLKLLGTLPGMNLNDVDKILPVIHGAAEAKAVTLSHCVQVESGLKMPGTNRIRGRSE